MELWQYLALFVVVALSPLLGMLMINISPDEHAPGQRWFKLLRSVSLLMIAALFLWMNNAHAVTLIALLLGLTLLFLFQQKQFSAALLGIGFWFATTQPLLPISLLFFFLAGMAEGSIAVNKKKLKSRIYWQYSLCIYQRYWPFFVALPLHFF